MGKRGHRYGRGCVLGRSLCDSCCCCFLVLRVAAVVAVVAVAGGVAVLVNVYVLLNVDGCCCGLVGGGVAVCVCGCCWFPVVGCWLC